MSICYTIGSDDSALNTEGTGSRGHRIKYPGSGLAIVMMLLSQPQQCKSQCLPQTPRGRRRRSDLAVAKAHPRVTFAVGIGVAADTVAHQTHAGWWAAPSPIFAHGSSSSYIPGKAHDEVLTLAGESRYDRRMLVFIDESGDPGFRVDKGSSPIFVVAMVIFQSGGDADATNRVIRRAMDRLKIIPEFKFNKTSDRNKEEFFQAVYECPFLVRALVVEKKAVRSVHLRESKEDFCRFFVRLMMTYDDGRLDGAEVIIDGSGAREFKKELKSCLRHQLGNRIKAVRLSDSRRDPLVQLADMCAGAIGHSYRTDRQDAWRWRTMIGRRIDDVWELG